MAALFSSFFGLAYFAVAIVLPIVLATRYLIRRGRPAGWAIVVGASSLILSALGFIVALVFAARTVPPGHDMVNMGGMAAGLLLAFVVGAPLGSWAGAWGVVLLARPVSRLAK